jgi:hypothetical protein
MVMLKKVEKDKYILITQTHPGQPHRGSGCKNKTYRDWWAGRARGDSLKGTLTIGTVSIPEDLVGKKFKIYAKIYTIKKAKK